MRSLPPSQSCFVCGRANPIGLKLHFETDGSKVFGRFIPEPVHVGFSSVVHGGILATLLDEAMAWACGVGTKQFAYCAEMSVRFLHPARPGSPIVMQGKLETNRRNKLFEVSADLRDEHDRVLATATGKYLPLPATDAARFYQDFEGGAASVQAALAGPPSS